MLSRYVVRAIKEFWCVDDTNEQDDLVLGKVS